MLIINIIIFIISCTLLYLAGELIVKSMLRLSRYLGVTEFIVAFFVMAFSASLPNLFVGITSASQGIPELSFGDIMGNNMVSMTLAVALCVFFASKKEIPINSETIRATTFFTIISAVLPIILIADGSISRIDGVVLIGFFIYYIYWIFSKKERFTKIYTEEIGGGIIEKFKAAIFDIVKTLFAISILILAAHGMVYATSAIAIDFGLPLILVGIIIIGLGNSMPDIYFGVVSAKKGETSMILGGLMGSVIILSSLVLGIVSIISPIHNENLELSIINRIFIIGAAILFFLFSKTGDKITSKESCLLLTIYIAFITATIFVG